MRCKGIDYSSRESRENFVTLELLSAKRRRNERNNIVEVKEVETNV